MPNNPLVGLLYNSAVPDVIARAPTLVEYLEVIPERFHHDFGRRVGDRFKRASDAWGVFLACSHGRALAGHGLGLSLPSATPLDDDALAAVSSIARELQFRWYSEHLSVFSVEHGNIPGAQAGLGIPVAYDHEMLDLLEPKLSVLRRATGCDLLLENSAIFTQIPDMDMTEVEFFDALHGRYSCGMLLDVHNLYVSHRNGGPEPHEYIEALNPDCVKELHLAGGDELAGFYTDSHSQPSPEEVWELAALCARRFRNVRALVFEFHESYFERIGVSRLLRELERLHALASDFHSNAGANSC
jgi:uncharacterized protein (UPF0276 family)